MHVICASGSVNVCKRVWGVGAYQTQTETRKTYKALLDGDEFTGFDLSPGYVS